MLRSLSIAAAGTGVASLIVIACSGSVEPPPTSFGIPRQGQSTRGPTLTRQVSGTSERLQAVSPVNENVVWASGVAGTFALTKNGGRTWRAGVVSGAQNLEFRDVEGVSDKVAYLLSAGPGTASRIYKTTNGGRTWRLQFQNQIPSAFYDCFDFWTPERGLTFSDAVGSRFPVIRTTDGKTWQDIGDRLPAALPGEAGFAASGTCVATQGDRRAWIATGGAVPPRILATTDGGNSWNAYATPLATGPSAGAVTVAFRDPFHGIVAGGNLAPDPTQPTPTEKVALSSDGGKNWTLVKPPPLDPADFGGTVFGVSYVPGAGRQTVVVTGPGGTAWSPDEGKRTWRLLRDVKGFWAVAFASREVGWLVGTEGRILKISFDDDGRSDHNDDGDSNQAAGD